MSHCHQVRFMEDVKLDHSTQLQASSWAHAVPRPEKKLRKGELLKVDKSELHLG